VKQVTDSIKTSTTERAFARNFSCARSPPKLVHIAIWTGNDGKKQTQ